jgi:cell division protein FtsB
MEIVLALAILVLVAWFITAPLRHRRPVATGEEHAEAELADLEARKEAKYRQIRDAEADHAAGKLSDEDFQRLDRELRAEAIDILKRIDRVRGKARR